MLLLNGAELVFKVSSAILGLVRAKYFDKQLAREPVLSVSYRVLFNIVMQFPKDNFTVMLFHYDGKVDAWSELAWSAKAIHVMAFNQTKW
jgi:hypothetical protein